MDDILVIIITLVLTIVAAINQAKKKQQQKTPQTVEEEETDFWEEVRHPGIPHPSSEPEDDWPGGGIRREPIPTSIRRSSLPTFGDYSSGASDYDFDPDNEAVRQSEIILKPEILEPVHDEQGEKYDWTQILEGFTLEKAIIYSEIIRPKYF